MQTTAALLCTAIKSYLTESPMDLALDDSQVQDLYALANKHDVAHLIGFVLDHQVVADKDKFRSFFQAEIQALFRGEQQKYEFKRICSCLESANIDYLPLKGSVIRDFYPEAWHRTSCDIDILVRESELEKATQLLTKELGCMLQGKSEHDMSIRMSSGVHLELHYDFHEKHISTEEIWASSHPKNDTKCYKMPDELFLFCHIAHMAKHFKYGGCGFRPFIDLWLLEQKLPYDRDALQAMLDNAGLSTFSNSVFALMNFWFSTGVDTPVLLSMSDYILDAGAYGSVKNRVAIAHSTKAGKTRYFFSRAFVSLDTLKYKYPILSKHPYFYLFCQIDRWYHLLTKKHDVVKHELTINRQIDDIYISSVQTLIRELNL